MARPNNPQNSWWENLFGKLILSNGKASDSPIARYYQMIESKNAGVLAALAKVEWDIRDTKPAIAPFLAKQKATEGLNTVYTQYRFKFDTNPENWKLKQPPGSSGSPDWTYNKWVQFGLNKILGTNLVVDGIMGPATKEAIKKFQAKFKLAVDGIWGPQSEAALIKVWNVAPPGRGIGIETPGAEMPTGEIPSFIPMQEEGYPGKRPGSESWVSRNWLTIGLASVGVLLIGSVVVWYSQKKKKNTSNLGTTEALPS